MARRRPRGSLWPYAGSRPHTAWATQSVLLPKDKFPTKAHAIAWLRSQREPYKADRIEDSAIKPGGIPAGKGHFWRARQFNPHPGRMVRTLPIGSEGILLVREAQS
jgi:hypothetical protein